MQARRIIMTVAVGVIAARTARAQSTAEAESLFRQGKLLMAAGKLADACAAFDASNKIEPSVSTLLNAANCREKNGQLATAWGDFVDAERQTRAATDAASMQLHTTSTQHAQKLEPRLSTLRVDVPDAVRVDGLAVHRGPVAIDPGAWGAPLPVDGGTYSVVAAAPGYTTWQTTVAVKAEHDAVVVLVPPLLRTTAVEPPPAHPETPPGPIVTTPVTTTATTTTTTPPTNTVAAEPQPAHRSRVLPLALGIGGIALIGGAIGVELWASSTDNSANTAATDDERTSLWHSANDRRDLAIGLGAAGVACAGVAVWMFVRHHDESSPPAITAVVPTASPAGAGLALVGAW